MRCDRTGYDKVWLMRYGNAVAVTAWSRKRLEMMLDIIRHHEGKGVQGKNWFAKRKRDEYIDLRCGFLRTNRRTVWWVGYKIFEERLNLQFYPNLVHQPPFCNLRHLKINRQDACNFLHCYLHKKSMMRKRSIDLPYSLPPLANFLGCRATENVFSKNVVMTQVLQLVATSHHWPIGWHYLFYHLSSCCWQPQGSQLPLEEKSQPTWRKSRRWEKEASILL